MKTGTDIAVLPRYYADISSTTVRISIEKSFRGKTIELNCLSKYSA